MKRITRLMGYEKVINHMLEEESGASLRAVGAKAHLRPELGRAARRGSPFLTPTSRLPLSRKPISPNIFCRSI